MFGARLQVVAFLLLGSAARAFVVRHAVGETSLIHGETNGTDYLATVPERMQYWKRYESVLPEPAPADTSDTKYFLFDADIGGLNNIRLGWEIAGLIAFGSGRTLVLPPAQKFYLIDFGPDYFKPPEGSGASRVEHFVNIDQLKRGLRVLSFDEFLKEARSQYYSDEHSTISLPYPDICELSQYLNSDAKFLYAKEDGAELGRLFTCSTWEDLGQPRMKLDRVPVEPDADTQALLHGHFVWHPEVFELAAPIIADLGMWNYAALHARYGDLQYEEAKEKPSAIVEKWFASELGHQLMRPSSTLYISTDETSPSVIESFRNSGFQVKWSGDYFDNPQSPIADLIRRKGPVRINQLKGPVEQLVCVFSRVFIGTEKSTFTGYIHQMRINADAPLTMQIRHTDEPTPELVQQAEEDIAAWEQRDGANKWIPVGKAPSQEHDADDSESGISLADEAYQRMGGGEAGQLAYDRIMREQPAARKALFDHIVHLASLIGLQ